MTEGTPVRLRDEPSVAGTIAKMPRSEGRKRPRALVSTEKGEVWYYLDLLEEAKP